MNIEIKIEEKKYIGKEIKPNIFEYEDDEGSNKLFLFEEGIIIKREAAHKTILNLYKDPKITIIDGEYNLNFPIKSIEKYKNNDIVIYAYEIEGKKKKIEFKLLGD